MSGNRVTRDRVRHCLPRRGWLALLAGCLLAGPARVEAQLADVKPKDLDAVGIEEKLGQQIPGDLRFQADSGQPLTMADVFRGQRPVILTLNYSDCPMLCSLQLNGLVDALRELPLTPGQDFDVVTVSIDPLETPQRARLTKQKYVRDYGNPGAVAGWHFLVGDQANITRLADTVGFRYKYVPERKEYAHTAALILCMPDGRVSRYLYGVEYPLQTLKLSLVEAGEGKIGSTLDRVLLYCFHYDAAAGRYGPAAQRIMQAGAALTLIIIALGLVPVWLRRSAGARRAAATGSPSAGHAGLFLLPLAQVDTNNFFFPTRGSTAAPGVDAVFMFIFWLSVFFFALIVGLMTWFVIHYRRREGVEPEPSASHNNLLEAVWSIIPSLLVVVIFVWGFVTYMDMRQPPENCYEIRVEAKKWNWSFIYPNGHVDNNLHVPSDRPVQLVMSSTDVIHSLYIPAFRLKQDVVPGRYSKVWFQATAAGTHRLYCAEYCGTQHSEMLADVVVHGSGEFETWLADAANFLKRMTPVEAGQLLYTRRGCVQCHTLDGSAKAAGGPSFKGVFGTEQALTDGTTVVVDENYIRRSILEPQAQIRAGYKPVMPTFAGLLKDEEIAAVIEFIKSLK